MTLSPDEIERALYCVNEVVDRRRRSGERIHDWMLDLAFKLDLTSIGEMSPAGHGFGAGGEQSLSAELIGTSDAAKILGLTPRHVRRLTADLDGEIIGGKLLFRRTTVIEYSRERT